MGNIFQWAGQARHAFTFLAGVLVAWGFISATQAEINTATELLSEIIKQTQVLVGLVVQFFTMVMSWRDKSKTTALPLKNT